MLKTFLNLFFVGCKERVKQFLKECLKLNENSNGIKVQTAYFNKSVGKISFNKIHRIYEFCEENLDKGKPILLMVFKLSKDG